MPVYNYRAVNGEGRSVKGVIDAESVRAASEKLKKAGVYLSSIKEATRERRRFADLPFTGGVSSSELAVTTRQFSTLLSSGLTLESSLSVLCEQSEDQKLREVLSQVRSRLGEGASLHAALGEHKGVFSDLYVNMVRAGEESGALDVVLERVADFLEKNSELVSRVRGAMIYPAIMFAVGMAVLVFIMAFVIPRVSEIFEASNKALPLITVVLVGASDFMRGNFVYVLIASAAAVFVSVRYARTERGRRVYDRFVLGVPVLGKISSKVIVSRFSRTLSTLLSSGIPLLDSIEVSGSVLANSVYADSLADVRVKVAEGAAFGTSLRETGVFPPVMVRMVSIGEESGEVEAMLSKVADMYDSQVDRVLASLTSLLEPVMILVMGVVMGFIVFAILLPVLNLTSAIG